MIVTVIAEVTYVGHLIGPTDEVASSKSVSLPDFTATNPEHVLTLEQYRSTQYQACIWVRTHLL